MSSKIMVWTWQLGKYAVHSLRCFWWGNNRCHRCYSNRCHSLADLQTTKFPSGSLATLHNLPPTLDAFCKHLQSAALSMILMKFAHIAWIPEIQFNKCGWHLLDKTIDAFPKKLEQSVKCNSKMKCARNCTCSRNNVQCYCVLCIVCACKGEIDNNDD